jgi:hypothetical protein
MEEKFHIAIQEPLLIFKNNSSCYEIIFISSGAVISMIFGVLGGLLVGLLFRNKKST